MPMEQQSEQKGLLEKLTDQLVHRVIFGPNKQERPVSKEDLNRVPLVNQAVIRSWPAPEISMDKNYKTKSSKINLTLKTITAAEYLFKRAQEGVLAAMTKGNVLGQTEVAQGQEKPLPIYFVALPRKNVDQLAKAAVGNLLARHGKDGHGENTNLAEAIAEKQSGVKSHQPVFTPLWLQGAAGHKEEIPNSWLDFTNGIMFFLDKTDRDDFHQLLEAMAKDVVESELVHHKFLSIMKKAVGALSGKK